MQKITTALYLVSSLFPESEPLRTELRQKSLRLLSDVRLLSDEAIKNEHIVSRLRTLLEHVLALMDIAARSALVSRMNYDFLKAEIESFAKEISQEAGKGERSLMYAVAGVAPVPVLTPPPLKKKLPKNSKGHHKRHDIGQNVQRVSPVFGQFATATGPIKDISMQIVPINDRKERIYKIIEEKGSLTIKDISQVAPEYSEKTIQRDLVDMVQSGRLKKKGERRWTIYYIE